MYPLIPFVLRIHRIVCKILQYVVKSTKFSKVEEKLIDGWSLRQTNTRLKRCVSGSVIRVIAPHPLLPFPPSFFLLLRPKMLLSSSYATSYLIRRNYTWCLLGFDLILSSTLYVNGDCNSETLFRKQLMMIWLDATSSKIALSFRAIRHFEWCSIFLFFFHER